ncbi:hypothetical protein Neosp_009295 [[Neocosmospora] mangrovei]
MKNPSSSLWVALSLIPLLGEVNAKSIWSSSPGTYGVNDNYILKSGYPVGNGILGGMHFGEPGHEKIVFNVDSLWSGGPFENSAYAGGNPTTNKSTALPGIREYIFDHGTGNVSALLGSSSYYGSYRVLGNFSITIGHATDYTNYTRSLDLSTGVHTTTYLVDNVNYTTTLFCSNPADACVYRVTSDEDLPNINIQFENLSVPSSLASSSCSQPYTRFRGVTQLGDPEGMKYDAIARFVDNRDGDGVSCGTNGSLTITRSSGFKTVDIIISAGTNYDATKGNAENDYSFRGDDPAAAVQKSTSSGAQQGYDKLLKAHIEDYQSLFEAFTLSLPDAQKSADQETAVLISNYSSSGTGDPYLESLLFDYSRYLLIASSRENSLPANLQGKWTEQMNPSWSSDYHANINIQMNYWAADQTGLGRTSVALWNYMKNTWVPRGTETAKLLYDAPGWVVHNEMNIFGHTGMKGSAGWANYPVAAAWIMQHVWDNFEYGRSLTWLREEGYPFLKAIAQFWISQLQDDEFNNDGTLVVNPCNSAEHGPTTFGCTHYQQLIHQVLEATLNAITYIDESDKDFTSELKSALKKLDKGLHYTSWGGIKEWKLPDSAGYDTKNTHRHLSHLVGWYPGYSVSSFQGGYRNSTVQAAVEATLKARGNGVQDQDTGWGKAWRAACWARLNNTSEAYSELRLLIDNNFAPNGFDMYQGQKPPFQIDANFGLGGAVLSMLVVDLPNSYVNEDETRTVVLGPAIPPRWGGGSVKNLRLRGGSAVDFEWDSDGKVTHATLHETGKHVKLVNVLGEELNE